VLTRTRWNSGATTYTHGCSSPELALSTLFQNSSDFLKGTCQPFHLLQIPLKTITFDSQILFLPFLCVILHLFLICTTLTRTRHQTLGTPKRGTLPFQMHVPTHPRSRMPTSISRRLDALARKVGQRDRTSVLFVIRRSRLSSLDCFFVT
jgi:hypothetical protein